MDFPEEEGNHDTPPTKPPKPTPPPSADKPPVSSITSNQCSHMRNPNAYRFVNSTQTCYPLCTVDNIFNQK